MQRGRSAVTLRRKKDGDARHQQSLRQAFHDGVEQSAQIGLRVQAAAELYEGLAVVEALLVEDAVYAGLNRSLERIEDQPRNDDRCKKAPYAQARQPCANQLRRQREDAEVESDQ